VKIAAHVFLLINALKPDVTMDSSFLKKASVYHVTMDHITLEIPSLMLVNANNVAKIVASVLVLTPVTSALARLS